MTPPSSLRLRMSRPMPFQCRLTWFLKLTDAACRTSAGVASAATTYGTPSSGKTWHGEKRMPTTTCVLSSGLAGAAGIVRTKQCLRSHSEAIANC